VAVLAAERVLADLDERPPDRLEEPSRWALAQFSDAARWAQRFTQGIETSPKGFRRHGAPNIVRHAVLGIVHAGIPDPDTPLHDLLVGAIEDCAAWVRCSPDPVPAAPGDAAPAANVAR
jgi:hypothetical protein